MTRVLDRLIAALADVSAVFIAFIVVAMAGEVVMRHFFARPLSWTVEVTEYLLLYVTFFAAAAVLKDGGHVTLDLFSAHTSAGTRKFLKSLSSLLAAAATGLMFFFSATTAYEALMAGTSVLKTLEVPRWLVLFPLPLGFLLLTVEFLRELFTQNRNT